MTPTRFLTRRALPGVAVLTLALGGAVGAFATVGVSTAGAATSIGPVDSSLADGATNSLRDVLENQVTDGDTVVLEAGATYTLDFCNEVIGSLALSPGQVDINASVTIDGNGATIEQTCPNRVLFTQDPLTLRNVTITGGGEDGDGGGLLEDSDNPIVLDGVTFTGNTATAGGGVTTFGDATISGSTFTDNESTKGNGGGLHVVSGIATVTVDGSVFDQNHASQWGGGIEQDSESTKGAAAAGEFNLTVTNSSITNNTAASDGGGGIDNEDPSEITIDHSTVSGNTGAGGGGIGSFATTTLHVNASTFNGNSSGGNGGAVQISSETAAAAAEVSSADFTNSTINGNTESSFGAVAVTGGLTFDDVTMTNNTTLGDAEPASTASGRGAVGALADDSPSANIAAFAFASFGSVVAQPQGGANCNSSIGDLTFDNGYNFSDDTSCGFTAATSKVATPNDPLLGSLADNGGPTATLLPLVGSPLLDAIPPAACGLTVDQRGVTRPQGTGCDIGAVEVEVVTPAPAAVVTPRFTG